MNTLVAGAGVGLGFVLIALLAIVVIVVGTVGFVFKMVYIMVRGVGRGVGRLFDGSAGGNETQSRVHSPVQRLAGVHSHGGGSRCRRKGCGHHNRGGARYCSQCGDRLRDGQ